MRESHHWTYPSIEFTCALRFLHPVVQMSVRQHPVFIPAPVYQEIPIFPQSPAQVPPPLIVSASL